jgi:hypothetical protein
MGYVLPDEERALIVMGLLQLISGQVRLSLILLSWFATAEDGAQAS